MDHFTRALIGSNGDDTQDFCEGLHERMFVGASEHEKTDRAVERGDQECGVGYGYMIWSQQCPALDRNVFEAADVEAIQRVSGEPTHTAQTGMGQKIDGICASSESCHRGPQKNCRGAKMQIVRRRIVCARRHGNADEGEEIRCSDDSALLAFIGPMLDERVDRNDEEAASE